MTLILLGLAWLAGIAAVALWSAPPWVGAMLVACLIPAAVVYRRWKLARLLAAMVIFSLAGGLIFSTWQQRATPDAVRYIGRTVAFQAIVVSEPVPSESASASVVALQRIRTTAGWVKTSGRVRLTLSQYNRLLPGDRVEGTGELASAPVFDDFDYRAYLARQDIVATIYRPSLRLIAPASPWAPATLIARARLRLDAALQRALPEPAASLAGGIAFGRDAGMSDAQVSDFRDVGLAHIVAVSGANVALIAAMAFALLLPLVGRRWAVLPVLLLVAAYVVVAGASASVVRAGVMAVILLAGEWLGRPQSGLPALAGAVVIMTALQPAAALDVGFQLSVAATAGLIAFSPWIRWLLERCLRRGIGRILPAFAFEAAALTLSATIATLPLLWVDFGRVSFVSPLANILVAPLVVVALPLSMAVAILGILSPIAAWLLALVAYYPVAAIIFLARHLADIPGAAISVPSANGTFALLVTILLAVPGWFAYRYLAPSPDQLPPLSRPLIIIRRASLGVATLAASAIVIVVSLLPIGGPGDFEMRALDIGQGDAILLTTPHGHTMLVDGGPSDMLLARQLGAALPHWDRSLDIVFLTHPDQDHVGGLPGALRRFGVANLWDTGVRGPSDEALVYADESGRTTVHAGDFFELDGARVDILWPPEGREEGATNATSLVLRVTYGDTRFLLTGDLEAPQQRILMASGSLDADVLKVPHHGSKTSAPAFFDAVNASLAVISVGAHNSYGHPAASTLAALANETVLRTDLNGRITVRSDGHKITWRTER